MKKTKLIYTISAIVMIISCVFSLAGCKTYVPNADFSEEFGKVEGPVYDTLEIVTTDDTVLTAYDKIQRNFNALRYIAYRSLIAGEAVSGSMHVDQHIYTTYIRERNIMEQTDKVYFEDSAYSTKGFGNSIVKTFANLDGNKGKYLVKLITDANDMKEVNGYPMAKYEENYRYEEYNSNSEYYDNYFVDMTAVDAYTIDETTVDLEKSSVTEDSADNRFINVKIVFKKDALQQATAERRKRIKLKAEYSVAIKEVSSTTFNELEMTFKLWKSGNLRSLHYIEDYSMETSLGSQKCNFDANVYFSSDKYLLPIKEFEFTKPQ